MRNLLHVGTREAAISFPSLRQAWVSRGDVSWYVVCSYVLFNTLWLCDCMTVWLMFMHFRYGGQVVSHLSFPCVFFMLNMYTYMYTYIHIYMHMIVWWPPADSNVGSDVDVVGIVVPCICFLFVVVLLLLLSLLLLVLLPFLGCLHSSRICNRGEGSRCTQPCSTC